MKPSRRFQDDIETAIAELACIDRTTPDYRADAAMVRKLFKVEPDKLSDQEFELHHAKVVRLALDASGIKARAHVLRAQQESGDGSVRHLVTEDQLLDAGVDPETTAERQALLVQHDMIDPALSADEPEASAPEPGEPSPTQQPGFVCLEDVRCLEALSRLERGATRKELAEHYGKSPRTIYTWLEQAKKLRLNAFDKVRPAEKLAEATHDFDVIRTDLLRSYEEAKRKGHSRLSLEILRELRAWRQQDLDIWSAIGLFGHYKHPAISDEMRRAVARQLAEGL